MSISALTDTDAVLGDGSLNATQLLFRPIKRLAFWTAIVLPFLHLSLLISGLESQSTVFAFFALLIVNAVAVYVGQPGN
ncbi:hypothetical protein ACFQJ7_16765 [Halovenus rubra]|uniref:Uncharacterized protein n=2 Tax=Halovenus rubra TaxID=869890 RepID=A0ABD5XCI9_9EURY|nr:hypothetical protein [Halovenus rubra]